METRFRLFRSRALWLGVPGLVFLLWAWWLSMGHHSSAGFVGPSRCWIGLAQGEVIVSWNSEEWPDRKSFHTLHRKADPLQERQWRKQIADFHNGHPIYRCVFIPFHALVPSYVALWAGLLIWRWRKRSVAISIPVPLAS